MSHVQQRTFSWSAAAAMLALALVGSVRAQDLPGQALPNLIRGNERFGRLLLQRVHRKAPDRNIVVSPISLSIILGALQSGSWDRHLRKEIGDTFAWGPDRNVALPSRMLLVVFEKPAPPRAPRGRRQDREYLPSLPEAAWISNTVLYRGNNTLSEHFVDTAQTYFGMAMRSTGARKPSGRDLPRYTKSTATPPATSHSNDVLINSTTHLRTAWKGNTFSLSHPHHDDFETASGQVKTVKMLTSDASLYRYAKTEVFEAVVLPCNRAYMLAVLPAPGRDFMEFVGELAASPATVDGVLKEATGTVTMPPFRIQHSAALRQVLEELGIRQVFKDLGRIMTIPGSRLTEINQSVNIEVDRSGIRADAETVGGAIYGGIGGAIEPFRMKLNRPFVFMVRDLTTDVLLFLGVVIDPTLK